MGIPRFSPQVGVQQSPVRRVVSGGVAFSWMGLALGLALGGISISSASNPRLGQQSSDELECGVTSDSETKKTAVVSGNSSHSGPALGDANTVQSGSAALPSAKSKK
jgi:hypothetical protein